MHILWQLRHWSTLMNEPDSLARPLYWPLRARINLSPAERLEARRQQAKRYLNEHGLVRPVQRLGGGT